MSFLGSSFLLYYMRQIVFAPDTAGLETRTTLCPWRLCPSLGTKDVISLPDDSLTSTHFLFALLGFFGFLMTVLMTTALANGVPFLRGFLSGLVFLCTPLLNIIS